MTNTHKPIESVVITLTGLEIPLCSTKDEPILTIISAMTEFVDCRTNKSIDLLMVEGETLCASSSDRVCRVWTIDQNRKTKEVKVG